MMQAEFNPEDFSNTAEADKKLLVKFFYLERPDKVKSAEEGRPIFKEVAHIEISVAGRRTAQACRPATLADISRFRAHYDAFIARVAPPTEGLPLSEWPQIVRSQVERLAYLNVKTLEQLVTVSDSDMAQLQGGQALKAKAKAWLELANEKDIIEERDGLKIQIAQMQGQIDLLLANSGEKEVEPEVKSEVKTNSRRRKK